MGWCEATGPSQQMVAHRVRNRAADCLADTAGLLLAAPNDEHVKMLHEALRLYRLAQAEDEQ